MLALAVLSILSLATGQVVIQRTVHPYPIAYQLAVPTHHLPAPPSHGVVPQMPIVAIPILRQNSKQQNTKQHNINHTWTNKPPHQWTPEEHWQHTVHFGQCTWHVLSSVGGAAWGFVGSAASALWPGMYGLACGAYAPEAQKPSKDAQGGTVPSTTVPSVDPVRSQAVSSTTPSPEQNRDAIAAIFSRNHPVQPNVHNNGLVLIRSPSHHRPIYISMSTPLLNLLRKK